MGTSIRLDPLSDTTCIMLCPSPRVKFCSWAALLRFFLPPFIAIFLLKLCWWPLKIQKYWKLSVKMWKQVFTACWNYKVEQVTSKHGLHIDSESRSMVRHGTVAHFNLWINQETNKQTNHFITIIICIFQLKSFIPFLHL